MTVASNEAGAEKVVSGRRRGQAAVDPSRPKRPAGRSLAEFQPLRPAEKKLLRACALGKPAVISDKRPEAAKAQNRIRAPFLRFLALGGDDQAPVHEKGIQLGGAYIVGGLDLEGGKVTGSLRLWNCQFEKTVNLMGTNVADIDFDGSLVPGIDGDSVVCNNIFLRNGFCATGEVRFLSAKIRNSLDCGAGRFENEGDDCLSLDAAEIGTFVFLNNGFHSVGHVRLPRVAVGGHIICTDCRFENKDGDALSLESARVGGFLFFRSVRNVEGSVSLTGMQVDALCDDIESWRAPLILDGFSYNRIDSGATDAETRITWLGMQRPELNDDIFWPQPWEQAAKVLRTMGHSEAAKLILIEKQRELYRLGLIGRRQPQKGLHPLRNAFMSAGTGATNLIARLSHRFYGALAGYGYRPMRTVGWMIAMWAFATAVYSWGEGRGLFAPRSAGMLTEARFQACAAPSVRWTRCSSLPPGYNSFDPTMFSLDAILPVVDLKQETDWAPVLRRGEGWRSWDSRIVRGTMWAEILFGWITSLLLASAVGRLMQKD